ncbi:MAG: hypothetical protein PVI99_10495 [Anaerolineales bacterium]|jgi:hypothetical protein
MRVNPTESPKNENVFTNNILRLGLIAVVVGLVSASCIGVFVFPLFDRLFSTIYPRVEWANLEGFTGLISLMLLFGGLIFALVDRRQTIAKEIEEKRKLSYEQFQTIHDRLVESEQEEARRWIITTIPVKPEDQPIEEWFEQVTKLINRKPKEWKEARTPGQQHVKQVLNNLDFIGFVSEHFWQAREADLEWLSPPVAKVWLRLGPYVEHMRELRQEPDYYKSASTIGDICIAWRKAHDLPESEFVAGV